MRSSCEVLRFGQISGNTQDGRRQAASTFGSLHAIRYMLAVGPPMSEITPVKPGVLSRIRSISRRIEPSERFWMMRPSCSVIEQNVLLLLLLCLFVSVFLFLFLVGFFVLS